MFMEFPVSPFVEQPNVFPARSAPGLEERIFYLFADQFACFKIRRADLEIFLEMIAVAFEPFPHFLFFFPCGLKVLPELHARIKGVDKNLPELGTGMCERLLMKLGEVGKSEDVKFFIGPAFGFPSPLLFFDNQFTK